MTKKQKMQKFFDESGFTKQLTQLIASGALPGTMIDVKCSDEIKKKVCLIFVKRALSITAEAYSEKFTVAEIDELIEIYKQPIMKKVQRLSSEKLVEKIAQHFIENDEEIDQEIDELFETQKSIK